MPIEEKACKMCGRVEAMGHSCELCLACRIKKANKRANSHRRKYYEKNREKILARMKAQRAAKDTFIAQVFKKIPNNRAKWTVEFIKTDGKYTWRAWFRNPDTERLVKFEAGRQFATIIMAKEDYRKAVL